jgi:predicted TIM-barrel fold metal-dependent hydrolase
MTALDVPTPTCQPPNPDLTPPRTAPPPGACDCHTHVFGPARQYRYVDGRRYTPPDSPLQDHLRMLDAIGLSRGILVQPSVYGTDNSCLLDALDAAPTRLRGVVILDVLAASDETLRDMTDRGVRALRIDAKQPQELPEGHLRRIAERIAPFGWHIDLLPGQPAKIPELLPQLRDLAVPVIIEGMGMMMADLPVSYPGFQALLDLVRRGQAWVKLSHIYKISVAGPPYADVAPFARALIAADPSRLIWGSDWPHAHHEGPMPTDGLIFDAFCDWAPDPEVRRQILTTNPGVLYGFD